MRKAVIVILLIVLAVLPAAAEQLSMIAVVNMNKVLQYYASDKQAWTRLENKIKEVDQELTRMKDEISNLEAQRLSALQSNEALRAIQLAQQIENKQEIQKSYYKVMTAQIEREKQDLYNNSDALDKIQRELINLAEDEGYTAVFQIDATQNGILWYSPTIDITDLLLKRLGLI